MIDPTRRRGAILLEILLSLSLFIMAGLAILSLMQRGVAGLERWRMESTAADLARSAITRIEAGLATPAQLDGPVRLATDEADFFEGDPEVEIASGGFDDSPPRPTAWTLQIQTDPTPHPGLTLVSISVLYADEPTSAREVLTLRQLVRLLPKPEDQIGGEDALMDAARRGAAMEGSARPGPPRDGRDGAPPDPPPRREGGGR